jgi:seryl-tRNA synthetase
MLDRNLIRTQPEAVAAALAKKRLTAPIDDILALDAEWRQVKTRLDEANAEMNRQSKSIGALMAEGRREEAEAAKAATKTLKEQIHGLEQDEREMEERLHRLELQVPNPPHESVPNGEDEADNVVVREWGERPDIETKPHWEIGEELGLLDAARGGKIAGSGFMVYTGWGARLQRALFNFMIDHQVDSRGYREVYPPYIVNRQSLVGTGQLPKFEEDLYYLGDDLFLIPTAEVPVTNLFRDEILEAWQLPMKMAAFSACFRKEAGAAGKDTRGLLRMHQFDKVELVKYALPETSYDELEAMVEDAESVLQALGLAYRVTLLCGGEMSFSNAKCYDLELWSPGVGRYLEISSCSNFEAFQARRANIRFRREPGAKPEFVHILNGSGLATPRLFAALIETYRQPDGSVLVPEPLQRYVGADRLTSEPQV